MIRACATLAVVLTSLATGAGAQASPYLPLDHPANAYVEALVARGQLGTLWRLERPYRLQHIRDALASDSGGVTSPLLQRWRERLAVMITPAPMPGTGEPAMYAAVEPFVTAQSSGRRELMLADTVSGVYPGFFLSGGMQTERLTLVGRVAFDRRLRDDPDYAGKIDRSLVGRNVEGYASIEGRHGELFFGRTGRVWGPQGVNGLQLGDAPYGYDHLYARLGSSRIRVSSLIAKLDTYQFGTDSSASRYFAAHRLAFRVGGVEIAGSETMVFGGVGRGFELAYANPLTAYHVTQYNEGQLGNVNVGLEVSARLGSWGIFAAQAMLDDLQIDDCGVLCDEPPSYGVTVAVEGVPVPGGNTLFGSYTRLTHLAYRTPAPFESYDFLGVGLGHAFIDYDELRAGMDLVMIPLLVVRPYGALRRQGEGALRQPFPTPAQYTSTPTFLAGTVMYVGRVGVTARGIIGRGFGVDADVGVNRIKSNNHVVGADDTAFEGRFVLRYAVPPFRW